MLLLGMNSEQPFHAPKNPFLKEGGREGDEYNHNQGLHGWDGDNYGDAQGPMEGGRRAAAVDGERGKKERGKKITPSAEDSFEPCRARLAS